MLEEWRCIPGTRYRVSSLGSVARCWKDKIKTVKPYKTNNKNKRYLRVGLGRGCKKYVHRLVADAFIGPCPAGKQINHKDGNPQNNSINNLEYVTPKENIEHAIENRLFRKSVLYV